MVSVNFPHALFSLLNFLTPEAGTKRVFQNVSKELPLYAAYYLRRVQISHDDLVMQALVWLCMFWFQAIQFDVVRCSASYLNLKMTSHL
jgi:hypothetical protein